MAIFTPGARGRLPGLAQLHNAFMRVVADDAIQHHVLALEQLLVLFVVFDEASLGVDRLDPPSAVTFAAQLGIAVDHHLHAWRVLNVQASGAMAGLTADSRFGPGADDSGQIVLVAGRAVAGRVTR